MKKLASRFMNTYKGMLHEIEKLYSKMIKAALNVRPSAPNDLVIIESGLKPLKSLIYVRPLNFYKRFKSNLQVSFNSSVK